MLLSVVLFLPLVGAIALSFVGDLRSAKATGLAVAVATFVASIALAFQFDAGDADLQLAVDTEWIPAIGAGYRLAVDGISLVLILLTTFLTPIILLASWDQVDRARGYVAAFLALETTVLGVFLATDLLLFSVFFEASLVPMYLIIGIWGGANRRYAAVKFFLYTTLGGLLMLVGILYLAIQAGSFGYEAVRDLAIPLEAQRWLFLTFFAAFAVKIPIFPVHTWLPDAHTEAPTAGSVFLAAVLLKLGSYGLLRFSLPLFPDATREFVPWILALAVIGILYGAIVALMQRDVKKLIAYSSVAHMGFIVLGIFALNVTATSAGVVQMVNHGLSTGALFLLIGFLYERRHTRQIAAFSGLARRVPVMAGFWLVVTMSSLALPGLNGFVGEFPILLGAYQSVPWAAVLGAFGVVLAALYLLWAYQRMFHGPLVGADNENTLDLKPLEIGVLTPLVALIVLIGVFPQPLYETVVPSVERVLTEMGGDVAAATADPVEPVASSPDAAGGTSR
jgi:NADH-quinone oxidoreductase subunit M